MAEAARTEETTTKRKPTAAGVAVLNNEERLRIIQLPHAFDKTNKGSIRIGPQIKLLPGWNFVPAEQWALAKENPMVRVLLEERIPAMKAPEHNQEKVGSVILEEGPQVDLGRPLGGVDQAKAVAMVGEIFDERVLRQMLRQEERDIVATALRTAIERITTAGKKT